MESAAAFLGALIAVFLAAVIVWYVLYAIANMKIFSKAGEAGWKAWIPILNTYTSYNLCWDGKFFWLWVLCSVIGNYTYTSGNAVVNAFGGLMTIAALVISLLKAIRMSNAFGHGYGFSIGLFFLEPIFTMILGFGQSVYHGKPERIGN